MAGWGYYVGHYSTVMDAELKGLELALQGNSRVIALDSQAVIARVRQLQFSPPRLWIEEGYNSTSVRALSRS